MFQNNDLIEFTSVDGRKITISRENIAAVCRDVTRDESNEVWQVVPTRHGFEKHPEVFNSPWEGDSEPFLYVLATGQDFAGLIQDFIEIPIIGRVEAGCRIYAGANGEFDEEIERMSRDNTGYFRPSEIAGIYPLNPIGGPVAPPTVIGMSLDCVEFNTNMLPLDLLAIIPETFLEVTAGGNYASYLNRIFEQETPSIKIIKTMPKGHRIITLPPLSPPDPNAPAI